MTMESGLDLLLVRAAAGDEGAFAEFYRCTAPRLFALLLRMMPRRAAAEELLQEVFIKIWRRAGDYHPGKGSALAWATAVARNRALDELRRASRSEAPPPGVDQELIPDPDTTLSPLEEALRTSEAGRVRDCLNTLDEKQKQSILLAFFHGHTHQQIGSSLNAPLGTVKSWVRRGLNRLKQCLEA